MQTNLNKRQRKKNLRNSFLARCVAVATLLVCCLSMATVAAQTYKTQGAEKTAGAAASKKPTTSGKLNYSTRAALREAFKQSISTPQVRLPEEDSIKAFERLVKKTLRQNSINPELQSAWRDEGWEMKALGSSDVVVVREPAEQNFGRGMYVFRMNSPSGIVLQAPHRFNDTWTGVIGRKLFTENDVRAIGFNTAHRKELDLAHCDQHYFNAFTAAVVTELEQASIIQLHGFTNDDKTNAGRTAKMIVSDTTRFPGRLARSTAAEFKTTFGKTHSLLYGVETRWLGGTKNRQAALAHDMGSARFIHLEMNQEFRRQLANEKSVRRQFFECVVAASDTN